MTIERNADRVVYRFVDVGDAAAWENVRPENRRFPELRATFNEHGVSLWLLTRYHGPQFELPLQVAEAAALANRLHHTEEPEAVINGGRWPSLTLRLLGEDVALEFRGSPTSMVLEVDLKPSKARALAEHIDRALAGHLMITEINDISADNNQEN